MAESVTQPCERTGQQTLRAQKAGQGPWEGNQNGRKYLMMPEHIYVPGGCVGDPQLLNNLIIIIKCY